MILSFIHNSRRFGLIFIIAFLAGAGITLGTEGDGGPNTPECEEGGPYNGEWTCLEAGEYVEGSLEIGTSQVYVALGDSPSDPVTGEASFTDGEIEREVEYDCPEPWSDTEEENESYGGGYEFRATGEDAPDYESTFDEMGTYDYDVYAIVTGVESSNPVCGPEEVKIGTITVTVVGVASVEGEGVTSTTSSPGEEETIYVLKGDQGAKITLTASSTSATEDDSAWPDEKPTWTGATAGESEGSATVPIDTVSDSKDGTTVTVTCGDSSKSINVVVYQVTFGSLWVDGSSSSFSSGAFPPATGLAHYHCDLEMEGSLSVEPTDLELDVQMVQYVGGGSQFQEPFTPSPTPTTVDATWVGSPVGSSGDYTVTGEDAPGVSQDTDFDMHLRAPITTNALGNVYLQWKLTHENTWTTIGKAQWNWTGGLTSSANQDGTISFSPNGETPTVQGTESSEEPTAPTVPSENDD